MNGLCYCNPQMRADGMKSKTSSWAPRSERDEGTMSDHAVNCPLRPQVLVTPASAAEPLYSTEWQQGYEAGYAAGLAAARSSPEAINR